MSSRLKARWAPRFRTAGALLLLVGAVAIVDLLLPRGADPIGAWSQAVQLGVGVGSAVVGAVSFWIGRVKRP